MTDNGVLPESDDGQKRYKHRFGFQLWRLTDGWCTYKAYMYIYMKLKTSDFTIKNDKGVALLTISLCHHHIPSWMKNMNICAKIVFVRLGIFELDKVARKPNGLRHALFSGAGRDPGVKALGQGISLSLLSLLSTPRLQYAIESTVI